MSPPARSPAPATGLALVQERLLVDTTGRGRGLQEITRQIATMVERSGLRTGLVQLFVRHTSCSLLIQENADPSARADLEAWLVRLAPEADPRYTHTAEGADDMPAHLRSAITRTGEQIPLVDGKLGLGTWQGIYLCEHRTRGGRRELIVTVLGY